ncbi:hypothetical protein C2S53_018932 [Perilla frutescens var. hirtella]|uniref:Uncharacterized protein n=1 Tax=Perilla frutescens var. hirtella TaxID=608512 RepID=A0AAD4P339_PERFH|nr:hypothetical protein C2S53_018932 [Perilla frutescens var. hirtella]
MGCSPEPITLQIAPSTSYSLSVRKCHSFPFSELPYSHFDEQLEDTPQSRLSTTASIDSLEFVASSRGEPIIVVEYMEKILMNLILGFNINHDAFEVGRLGKKRKHKVRLLQFVA